MNTFDLLNTILGKTDSNYTKVGSIDSVSGMFAVAINVLIGVTFAISLVGIAYAFVQHIISMGDKDALKTAQKALTWSVIAMVLSLIAVALKRIIFNLIGVDTGLNK